MTTNNIKVENKSNSNWYVYILVCIDNTLYTGITKNVKRRINKHNNKLGAKYVKGRLPVKLVYKEKYTSRSEAAKREYQIKNMSKLDKKKLYT
ncbi:MAG: GIY-YIG nuclease family protein [Pseudomonadota bacterium]|nr:GIY-YIG nuclease family protein [Pseudomonadota bacterium]